MNKLLKMGIATGLLLGVFKLIKMKTSSEKMVSGLSKPRIHKVDLKGLTFRTEISIQNPTQTSVTITKPVVTLTTGGKYITSSNPEQKSFTIKPLTTTTIDTIELILPWTALGGYVTGIIAKAPKLIAAFKAKDLKSLASSLGIPLEMKYTLYANGIFFESEPQKIM